MCVDKTAILYELAKPGADCIYCLPRPRRFGKSLMISTLKALFLGRRELFRGLKIDRRIDDETLLLKIPNHEVRQSLEKGYVSRLFGKGFEVDALVRTARRTAAQLAAEGYTDAFRTMLQHAYSLLPHDRVCKDEREAKRYFIAYMCFARVEIAGEPQHATGRPDAVLRTEKGVYVVEFKYAQSADAALKQCRDRNYAARFVGENLSVFYIGVNYDPQSRTIDDVRCESAL